MKLTLIYSNSGTARADSEIPGLVQRTKMLLEKEDVEISTSNELVVTAFRVAVVEGEIKPEDFELIYENKSFKPEIIKFDSYFCPIDAPFLLSTLSYSGGFLRAQKNFRKFCQLKWRDDCNCEECKEMERLLKKQGEVI